MTYRSQKLVGAKAVSQGKAVISFLGYEQARDNEQGRKHLLLTRWLENRSLT